MDTPILINCRGYQSAWVAAVQELINHKCEIWDLVVRIDDPKEYCKDFDIRYNEYAEQNNLLTSKQVSYTIFPQSARKSRSHDELRDHYLNRVFPKLMRMERHGWGTYFERMVNYAVYKNGKTEHVDQLGKIINSINRAERVYRAAYTMVIMRPGSENAKLRGAPCLNTLAVRLENLNGMRIVHLTAFYRNHDFSERAYGNYRGLCDLLSYIADETNSIAGSLTCISSHAFLGKPKKLVVDLIKDKTTEEC